MKISKSIILLIIVFEMISSYRLNAQYDLQKGYIISLDKDTVRGWIDSKSYDKMALQCDFYTTEKSQGKTYFPADITAYRIENGAYYITKKLPNGETAFLEFLVDGKLDVYYSRLGDVEKWYIETEKLPLKEVPFKREYVTVDGKTYLSETKTHIGLLKLYTKDAPTVLKWIENFKPGYSSFRSLAVDYHNEVCTDESCIIYKNKQPFTKVTLMPTFGTMTYFYHFQKDNLEYQTKATYGMYARFWMPRLNKDMYFRTGIILSKIAQLDTDTNLDIEKNIIKVPIQLEYVLPSYHIKPSASLGFNYYTGGYFSFGGSLGASMSVYKNVGFGLLAEREIYSVDVKTTSTQPYALLGYLFVKL